MQNHKEKYVSKSIDTNALRDYQAAENESGDQKEPFKITSKDLLNYQMNIGQKLQSSLFFRKNIVYVDKRDNGKLTR